MKRNTIVKALVIAGVVALVLFVVHLVGGNMISMIKAHMSI